MKDIKFKFKDKKKEEKKDDNKESKGLKKSDFLLLYVSISILSQPGFTK